MAYPASWGSRIISGAAVDAIARLMLLCGISPANVPFRVPQSATYQEAMRYAWRYVGNGSRGSLYPSSGPEYRIDRYIQALHAAGNDTRNIVLVDIGSGPGTFTWASMDWLRETRIARNDVHILAYDHCTAMMPVASHILLEASQTIVKLADRELPRDVSGELNGFDYIVELATPNGPANVLVEMYDNLDNIIGAVQKSQMEQAHYLVTFGYVLAANHADEAIAEYSRLISVVVEAAHGQRCTLVVCDTPNIDDSSREMLEPGWQALIDNLGQYNVRGGRSWPLGTGTTLMDVETVR